MRVFENISVAIEKGHLKLSLKLWPTNVIKFCYMHANISPLCRLDLLNCLRWRDVFELIVRYYFAHNVLGIWKNVL